MRSVRILVFPSIRRSKSSRCEAGNDDLGPALPILPVSAVIVVPFDSDIVGSAAGETDWVGTGFGGATGWAARSVLTDRLVPMTVVEKVVLNAWAASAETYAKGSMESGVSAGQQAGRIRLRVSLTIE